MCHFQEKSVPPRPILLCASLFGQRERGRLLRSINPHRRRDLQVISPLALTLSLGYQVANVDRRPLVEIQTQVNPSPFES